MFNSIKILSIAIDFEWDKQFSMRKNMDISNYE